MHHSVMIVNQGFSDINPLICGEERCDAGHSFGPASRQYYLLHYVLSGKGEFHSGGNTYTVSRGQLFVIRPNETTMYRADERDPWHYCWVGFEAGMDLETILESAVIDMPRAEHLFQALKNCDSVQSAKEFYICGKIFELLAMLSKDQAPPQGQTPQFVLKAINYIESNYVEDISVSKLAAYLNLDRSYFSTVFRKCTGKSPQQYIVDFRLEKAAELLTIYCYRPGEAGQNVGYPDIFHFSRMFKRKYGLSPTDYITRSRFGTEESGGGFRPV